MTDQQEFSEQPINPIWEQPDLKDLRKFRELKDEDLILVENLLKLPKKIAIEHHNFFSFSRDNTAENLEKEKSMLSAELSGAEEDRKKGIEEKITYSNIFKQIATKYDWTTAWGVNTVLERFKTKEE